MTKINWQYAVHYGGNQASVFFEDWFLLKKRNILMICGLGWDPRMTASVRLFKEKKGEGTRLLHIITQTPPSIEKRKKEFIEKNKQEINELIKNWCDIEEIKINKQNIGEYIGGEEIIDYYNKYDLSNISDIIIDIGALPKKMYFPLIKSLCEKSIENSKKINLFVVVCQYPILDGKRNKSGNKPGLISGFNGNLENKIISTSLLIWVPILGIGSRTDLQWLYQSIRPHDVYPVLPLSSRNPRIDDNILHLYSDLMINTWELDPQNIIYADEDCPLDHYRSLCGLYERQCVALEQLGSVDLVISPLSSKIASIGAFMAAYEYDFPIAHGIATHQPPKDLTIDSWSSDKLCEFKNNLHTVWIAGEPYID